MPTPIQEKDPVPKILTEMRKYTKFIEETNWMFDTDVNADPTDLM